MSRKLKWLIVFLSAIVFLAIVTASAIAYFNEEKIREITIGQLNKLLDTEVKVEQIEFSLLNRFPKAAIEFRNIEITEKSDRPGKPALIKASSLFLEFDPFDLFRGNYIIDQIYLTGAELNVVFFKDGSSNFNFFQSDSTSDNFQILLEKVLINNTVLNYTDISQQLFFSAKIGELVLTGDFNSQVFDLSVLTTSRIEKFSLSQFKTSKAYPLELDIVLKVERESEIYTIKNASAHIEKLSLVFSGTFQNLAEGIKWDIRFNTDKFDLSDISSLFPQAGKKILEQYEFKGKIDLDGTVRGVADNTHNPALILSFDFEDGFIKHKKSGLQFLDCALKGKFTNGEKQNYSTSGFFIEEVVFTGKQGRSRGNFSLVNFDNPFLKFEINSVVDLGVIKELVAYDSLEVLEGTGELNVRGETYLDSLSSISANDLRKARIRGDIEIKSGKLKWKGNKYTAENISAKGGFGDNLLFVDSISYSVAGVHSTIRGILQNFLPYVFFDNEQLIAQANVFYEHLDLNQLIENSNGAEESAIFLPVSDQVILNLNLSANKFSYKKFKAEEVKCEVVSKHHFFNVQNLSLKAMEGEFKGWIHFNVSEKDIIKCASKLHLEHININELFIEFENFGQNVIVAENLKGFTNSEIEFKANYDKNFKIIPESIEAICHIEIKSGELINYESVMALSKYVDVEELQHIRFSRLSNDIEIKNRMIYIPEMDIRSSALELKLSGKHSFDNEIDYHFQLNLNDFLFRKAKRSKKNKEEFGEVEVDESGKAKLFIRMEGTVDDYTIKLDRKALRDKWKIDFQDERKELKNLFKSEFGEEKPQQEEAPMKFEIEFEQTPEGNVFNDSTGSEESKTKTPVKTEKKKKPEKIPGKKIEDEYEEYDPNKFD